MDHRAIVPTSATRERAHFILAGARSFRRLTRDPASRDAARMSQSPLLPIALACASGFASLGCIFLQPRPAGGPPPSASYEPAGVEEQHSPGKSSENFNKGASHAVKEAAPPAKMIPISIEIRSDCKKTVPVFYGDGKPGFSSGKKSSISSNSISSEGRKHDGTLTIWIIDEHENGLSNVKITPDTRRVTVNSDCKSFKAE
jgi:hypothetical protein